MEEDAVVGLPVCVGMRDVFWGGGARGQTCPQQAAASPVVVWLVGWLSGCRVWWIANYN